MNAADSSIESICLFRLSALGDVCMCVPVVRTLQKAFPQATISWVISRPAHNLVQGLEGVEFIVIDKPRSPKDYFELYKLFKHRRFDVLLAMQASLRANLIYPLIRAKRKIGFDSERARDGQSLFTNESIYFSSEHLFDSFMRFAEAAGAHEQSSDFSLPLKEKYVQATDKLYTKLTRPVMLVSPCASKAERDWPLARLIETIQYAQKIFNATVLLIGGNSDREMQAAEQIKQACKVSSLIGKVDIKLLPAVIAEADVLLAPDTGPVHIARAMGTPVIGLYAVAPSWLTGPYDKMDYCVDHFNEAVESILGKDPETVPWKTRVHSEAAMQLITVEEVTNMVDKVLRSRS
jgi:heptosyltransferase I